MNRRAVIAWLICAALWSAFFFVWSFLDPIRVATPSSEWNWAWAVIVAWFIFTVALMPVLTAWAGTPPRERRR